jgi:hypothetical protein
VLILEDRQEDGLRGAPTDAERETAIVTLPAAEELFPCLHKFRHLEHKRCPVPLYGRGAIVIDSPSTLE